VQSNMVDDPAHSKELRHTQGSCARIELNGVGVSSISIYFIRTWYLCRIFIYQQRNLFIMFMF